MDTVYERILREVCGSEERFRLLRTLFENPGREFHVRGLAVAAGIDPSNASKLLGRLTAIGLCERVEAAPYAKFRANAANPLHKELAGLFSKASAVMGAIRDVAARVDGSVFIFGSAARGEDQSASDIDLLVITGQSPIKASGLFYALADKYQRKIQVTTASEKDILAALRDGSGFWMDVLSGPLEKIQGEIPDAIHRAVLARGQQGIPTQGPRLERGSGPSRVRRRVG